MLSSILLAAAAITGFVSAQNSSTTCYYSTSGPLAVDPNCIAPSLRQTWCNSQTDLCPRLCDNGQTQSGGNTCDAGTLNYTCVCASGNQPNVSAYMETVPFHVCESWRQYCVAGHPDDLDGITACQSVVCGTMNASEASSGGSSTTSSSDSATTSSSSSGSSDTATTTSDSGSSPTSDSGSSATSSGAAVALSVGREYGTGILGAGLLALFGLAL